MQYNLHTFLVQTRAEHNDLKSFLSLHQKSYACCALDGQAELLRVKISDLDEVATNLSDAINAKYSQLAL